MPQSETNNVITAGQTTPNMLELMAERDALRAQLPKQEAGTQPSTITANPEVTNPGISDVLERLDELTQESNHAVEHEDLATKRVSESAVIPIATNGTDLVKESATGIIDSARKDRIIERITKVLNNPRFWGVESRVDRLEDAAVIPMFDDKSLQGFATSAEKELIRKATETAIKNQAIPVWPTVDQIKALALEKHQEKQDKEVRKALKKNI
jgi:hypothetical protein